jgi:hypothetical protein
MNAKTTDTSTSEAIVGVSAVLVGLGVVTVALFPLAIPIVVLTAASAVPLLVLAVPAAILGAVWFAARALVRLAARRPRRRRRAPVELAQTELAAPEPSAQPRAA